MNLFIHFQEGVTEPPEQSGSIAVQDLREETSGLGDSEMTVVVRACSLSSTLLIIPKGNLINLQGDENENPNVIRIYTYMNFEIIKTQK